jgi:hypothetical protein
MEAFLYNSLPLLSIEPDLNMQRIELSDEFLKLGRNPDRDSLLFKLILKIV